MSRPVLEVADIFRDHGAAWRHANRGHVSLGQRTSCRKGARSWGGWRLRCMRVAFQCATSRKPSPMRMGVAHCRSLRRAKSPSNFGRIIWPSPRVICPASTSSICSWTASPSGFISANGANRFWQRGASPCPARSSLLGLYTASKEDADSARQCLRDLQATRHARSDSCRQRRRAGLD